MPKALTSTLKFLFARGTEADAVTKANEYCKMTPCHRVKYHKMPKTGGEESITRLSRELAAGGRGAVPNAGDIWLAVVEQKIPSTAEVNVGQETIQTHEVKVTDGNFDNLERLVNEFARDHIVIKHDLLWDRENPKTWIVMITYAVKYQ
ncbi:MAG: hypothetical protein HUU49_04275 [Candidatus Buchananbacteria bacterium]|nr:hypothetical protein [Candidatus Buchananbacteria bacterium]